MKKILVFDFDGTIADSKRLYINMIYSSLLEHSLIYPKSHITRALGPKLEITLNNINKFSPKLLQKLKKKINSDITKKAKSLKLCPYANETLKRLHENNKIFLLTNSSGKFVRQVLRYNKILRYFSRLYYAENFSSKEQAIKSIAGKYKTKIKDVIYIADKVSDVKIARNVGCRIIISLACSWDKNKLKGKNYTISSLNQLADALSK